jgi:hypothetical protein
MNKQPFNPMIATYQNQYRTVPQSNVTQNIFVQQRPATTYTAPAVNQQNNTSSTNRGGCCRR